MKTFFTEDEVRTYTYCSEYHHLGGTWQPSYQSKLIKLGFEQSMISYLSNPQIDLISHGTKGLLRAAHLLKLKQILPVNTADEIIMKTMVPLGEVLNTFLTMELLPLTGPMPWSITIDHLTVQLNISAIARTKANKTLHLIDFSPYAMGHSIQNDPIINLKSQSFSSLANKLFPATTRKDDCKLHSFSLTDAYILNYESFTEDEATPIRAATSSILKAMSIGIHFPVLPCIRQCSLKHKCKSKD